MELKLQHNNSTELKLAVLCLSTFSNYQIYLNITLVFQWVPLENKCSLKIHNKAILIIHSVGLLYRQKSHFKDFCNTWALGCSSKNDLLPTLHWQTMSCKFKLQIPQKNMIQSSEPQKYTGEMQIDTKKTNPKSKVKN